MFQNYFLNKSNVAKFLQEINVDQPPFVPDVRNFAEVKYIPTLKIFVMEIVSLGDWYLLIMHSPALPGACSFDDQISKLRNLANEN